MRTKKSRNRITITTMIKMERKGRGHVRDRLTENKGDDLKTVGRGRGRGATSTGDRDRGPETRGRGPDRETGVDHRGTEKGDPEIDLITNIALMIEDTNSAIMKTDVKNKELGREKGAEMTSIEGIGLKIDIIGETGREIEMNATDQKTATKEIDDR